ncbi:hypothetical protein KQI41_17265 [Tissierella pigra]|uniref:hypothetical protein n=1 Tax=Tissierella pigra TaxID=2607614 RepID=UPI001C107F3B|nr:hypothetical protein [Tissierella pigra]MBU5428146.1 hypothetical protein [Tissierella pigra]
MIKIFKEINWEKANTNLTKYFYEYIIKRIDIDVIWKFALNHINVIKNSYLLERVLKENLLVEIEENIKIILNNFA